MRSKALTEAMQRVESWPDEVQEELAGIALEMDAALRDEAYQATPEELTGIDRGLAAARAGRFASAAAVAALFAKHRPA